MDVHKDTVVVHVLAADSGEGKPVQKRYRTFRGDLVRLRVWLKQMRVTEIAMESTGVYWVPVWDTLEDPAWRMLLANPQQVKALYGRKSDRRDARRIAEFLQDRRLDASFVPPREIRDLRTLTRHRVALLRQRNQTHNQIRDLLEAAGVKLSSVASDVMGVSGQRILRALAGGEASAERLSWRVRGKLRRKSAEVKEAMRAEFPAFSRQMLGIYLTNWDFVTMQIEQMEEMIRVVVTPYALQVRLLTTIPGVEEVAAWNLLAEMGVDMSVFPDGDHCASWAGLSPGTNESAGVQHSVRTKKGNRYLRRGLMQTAWANSHRKDGYLRALFHRVKARRGWGKAIVAVAHKVVVIAYHILRDLEPYRELGGDYFDMQNPERTARRLLARLGRIGYRLPEGVSLIAAADAEGNCAEMAAPKRKRGRPRKVLRPDGLSPLDSMA